jgi:hypothetical protein
MSLRSYMSPITRDNVLASIYGGEGMQAYRVETTLQQDGTLTLSNLPLHAGETVEDYLGAAPSHHGLPAISVAWGTRPLR